MKRLLFAALALLICSPALAGWDFQSATSAVYVAQQVEEDGMEVDESTLTAATGLEFWRSGSMFGFAVGIVGLPDEEQDTPRVAPFASFNLGGPSLKFSIGGAYDPQNGGDNNLVLVTGGTFSF